MFLAKEYITGSSPGMGSYRVRNFNIVKCHNFIDLLYVVWFGHAVHELLVP